MKRVLLPILVGVLFLMPVWASEPGEPLDCSDWIADVPGYSCSVFKSIPTYWDSELLRQGSNRVVDNDGRMLFVRVGEAVEVVASNGNTEQVIGYIDAFRNPGEEPGVYDWLRPIEGCAGNDCSLHYYDSVGSNRRSGPILPSPLVFDAINGRLLIGLHNWRGGQTGNEHECYDTGIGDRSCYWIAAIEGFTTTFEVLQSYTPPSGPISFRVPYMPEGFQFADWFDTYYGTLATVGDWSQLQPLQCGYPASPPGVGDYLAVTDNLPTPIVGAGYYYVTAVTYQGQTRWGRQSGGGVLSGRAPAALPACVE